VGKTSEQRSPKSHYFLAGGKAWPIFGQERGGALPLYWGGLAQKGTKKELSMITPGGKMFDRRKKMMRINREGRGHRAFSLV